MNRDNELYRVVWAQIYHTWAKPKQELEPEITDFTEAQAVLARIMSK